MSDKGQRTEKPTPRRIRKTRTEGRFPISRDLVAALQFLAFAALVSWTGSAWLASFARACRAVLQLAFRNGADPAVLLAHILRATLGPLAFGGGLIAAVTLGAQLAVTGGGFAPKRLAPQFNRLSPIARLRDLPKQNVPSVLRALLVLPVFAWAVYAILGDRLAALLSLPLRPAEDGVRELAESLTSLLWRAAAVFLAAGAWDFWRQRARYLADLRMTKQEVREEAKELEGNPQIKARIRRIARGLVRRRMMQQVPKATAVIVNPTHYAVALRYNLQAAGAPSVVAKGRNYLAQRIRQRALEHEIPIIENPPLAQALYKSSEVGQEIPPNLYRAVAEVLAYIYRQMGGRLPG